MKYTASDLRRRVEIIEVSHETDPYGETSESETVVAEAWAARIDQPGREVMRAERVDAEQRVTYVVRYRPYLGTHHRLREGEQVFHIHSVVDVDGLRRYHELVCTRMEEA